MLWINLIMDSLGSLALATEPPYEELLHREPTRKEESIINGKMWKHIGFQSVIELVLLIFLYLYAPHFIKEDDYVRLAENKIIQKCFDHIPGNTPVNNIIYGTSPQWDNDFKKIHSFNESLCGRYDESHDLSIAYEEYIRFNAGTTHMAIVFNVFVIYTLFNQFNCRVIDDSFNIFIRMGNNLFFPVITLCELALQIILIEFGRDAFKCTERGLTLYQWLLVIAFSAVTFVLSFIVKLIPIDGLIQGCLDKPSDNKVANMDDLVKETKIKESNINEKHGISANIKDNNEDMKGSKILQGSIIIKSMRRNSSYNIGKNMRQKKPSIHVSNE
jgi:magnesium-transporting ATPase (P-type)